MKNKEFKIKGAKKRAIKAEEIAQYAITSKETAEVFIATWMKLNNATREMALARLKEWGIKFNKLRDKN